MKFVLSCTRAFAGQTYAKIGKNRLTGFEEWFGPGKDKRGEGGRIRGRRGVVCVF